MAQHGESQKPSEIPELVTELVDLSKDYLRQQTIEPAKQLGRRAGFGMAAGAAFAIAALYGGLAVSATLQAVLPEGAWYLVLARGLTVVATGVAAGIVAWGMTRR